MHTLNRRAASAAVLAALLPAARAVRAQAAAFPARTVSIVVGFPAGGATDVTARVVQPHLQKSLGQTVIVENVPGAGGSIGVQKMLNAPADGHALFLGTASDAVLAPLAIQTARYRAEHLRLLALMGVTDFIVATRPGMNLAGLDELVAHGRNPANKEFSYASFGNGSIYHLLGEDLQARTGSRLLHVPFQGMGPTINALMGNQVDVGFLPVAGQTVGLVNSGRLKALAVTASKRNALLPQVPSVDESKNAKGFHHNVWLGMFGPASLPTDAAAKVNSAVNQAIRSTEYVKYTAENGMVIPEPGLSLQQAARFYADEADKLRQLANSIKLEAK